MPLLGAEKIVMCFLLTFAFLSASVIAAFIVIFVGFTSLLIFVLFNNLGDYIKFFHKIFIITLFFVFVLFPMNLLSHIDFPNICLPAPTKQRFVLLFELIETYHLLRDNTIWTFRFENIIGVIGCLSSSLNLYQFIVGLHARQLLCLICYYL